MPGAGPIGPELPNLNLHEVMVLPQNASLSFQTMVPLRDRLVNAYQKVMDMRV
jgi:flagellar hook-basal body complex protein FliE